MIFPCPILDTTPASEAATTQSCPFPGFLSADGFVMTNQFDQLLADFSDGASDVIDALVASATGVRSPSLSVRGDGQQARQVNAGSLVRLTDGTYHVIAFTNGAQVRAEAVCLRLKPLAGGQAKDFYPAELANTTGTEPGTGPADDGDRSYPSARSERVDERLLRRLVFGRPFDPSSKIDRRLRARVESARLLVREQLSRHAL